MSTFKFRLETLLKMRSAERDQRRASLAEAEEATQILVDSIEAIDQEEEAARAHRAHTTGEVNVDILLSAHRYQMVLNMNRQQLQQQKKILDNAVEERLQLVVEADRKVRMLEKLKEKQLNEFDQAALLREIKEFDEVSARVTGQSP